MQNGRSLLSTVELAEQGQALVDAAPWEASYCSGAGAPQGTGNCAPAAFNALVETVCRLQKLIDLETDMLRNHRVVAFDDFNRKKSHGLIELRRAIDAVQSLPRAGDTLDLRLLLASLHEGLQRNLATLQIHLNAANALAAAIARTIREHDSDGTYTRVAAGNEMRSCCG